MTVIELILFAVVVLCHGNWADSRGLVVVPGLGREDRLKTVVSNLKLLEKDYINGKNNQKWDCVIYVYAPRYDSFWSLSDIQYVQSLCKIVENPNKRVTENLYMLQPALIRSAYSKVLILLDDCRLPGNDSFDLVSMLRTMKQNDLTVISPMVSPTVSPSITLFTCDVVD